MLSQTVLVALLAATVQAVANPQVTPPPSLKKRFEIPGLDDTKDLIDDASDFLGSAVDDAEAVATCIDLVEDVLDEEAPTPTGDDLKSAWSSAFTDPAATDMCFGTVMPDSLTESWSAYEQELVSWYVSASPTIQSAADACPTMPDGIQDAIKSVLPCSTALEAAGVTPVAFDGSPDGDAPDSTDEPGAAPQVTGVFAGVAAVAIGAAAVLL